MAQLPDPISRRDRQRQTREALIFAARRVFAEDGYHAASLDRIAREAGFSKGAVYSNFDGKSALFLAVMDANMALDDGGVQDPFEQTPSPASTGRDTAEREGFPLESAQGFALATLEFIAAAARDETLSPQLRERLRSLIGVYVSLATRVRPDGERLPAQEVGTLLAALDQGTGLLLLAGDVSPDPEVFNDGMRRLIDPARAATEGPDEQLRADHGAQG